MEGDVCFICDENYFLCGCGERVPYESGKELNGEYFCNMCYFEAKEVDISGTDIRNPVLVDIVENDIKVYSPVRPSEFVFVDNGGHKHYFIVKKLVNHFRFSSFGSNVWFDLCSKPEHIVKAIQWIVNHNIINGNLIEFRKGK